MYTPHTYPVALVIVVLGLFYPFVAKALVGQNHLGPYTVYFVFLLGALASNVPLNYAGWPPRARSARAIP